jgi:cell filamentation protein
VIFQDAYEWAGEFRICNIRKQEFDGSPGTTDFLDFRLIAARCDALFGRLAMHNNFAGMDDRAFCSAAADFLTEINHIHPFREGNGRVQRALLQQIGFACGRLLEFDVITKERMIAISIAGSAGDPSGFVRMLEEIIDPDRVRALRKAIDFLSSKTTVSWNDIYLASSVAGQKYDGILAGTADPDFLMRMELDRASALISGHVQDLKDRYPVGTRLSFRATRF